MLKLILGPSGSGKTERLLHQISLDVQEGKRCYYLVPEQEAYISERNLPAHLPSNAGLYLEITDFSGLCNTVFDTYGGVTRTSVDPSLRALVMWDTLRELSPLLRQYGKSAKNDSTLTQLMLSCLSELRNSGITPQMLEDAAAQCEEGSPLQNKLLDMALVDVGFHQKIRDCFGSDPEEKLLRMASVLERQVFFKGARVYIDSFAGFTAEEYAVLRRIMAQAELVVVALCTDDTASKLPHFQTTCDTAKRLKKMASDQNIPCEASKLRRNHGERPSDLAKLEADLWNFRAILPTEPRTQPCEAVRLFKCRNIYEEAEAAALHILELTHQGYRYGDIALVMRDTETYRGVLDAALDRYGIPYFLSERTDFSSKPLFRLLLSALRCVCRGYRSQDVMTLAKTGLTGVSVRDVSLFEEYCNTWHIGGKQFLQETWSMNPDGLTTVRSDRANAILEAANQTRRTLILPLEKLSLRLRAAETFGEKCKALYQYMHDINITATLSEHAKRELSSNRRRQASETLRLYRQLTEMLTKAALVLPDVKTNREEFSCALSILFSSADMGSVPNVNDCVMIGSASTLRIEKIDAALLLGLCEGEFPRNIVSDGILSDSEKEVLEEFGIVFASRDQVRFSEELLYVYRAVTKPREKLYLSTVAYEADGSARTPSLAFNRVKLLLGLEAETFDLAPLRKALNASAEKNVPSLSLPSAPAGTALRLSQSKIRSFLLCPYSYYASYQLQLREKKDSTPSYADDGNFLHFIFEHFLKHILQDDGSVMLPQAEEIEPICDSIIADYIDRVCPCALQEMDGHLLHIYTRLRRLAKIMLTDMVEELHYTAFVPTYFEQVIGMSGENGLPPMRLDLKDGCSVSLSGKIDRVDLYKAEDTVYVRVVDYKSGEHKFTLSDVSSGLDIQLILYLWAFIASDPTRYTPAGAAFLYAKSKGGTTQIMRSGIRLENEEVKYALDASVQSDYTKHLIPQTAAELEQLSCEMLKAVKNTAERILSGEAQKTPSKDACRFCPVADHCDKAIR